MRRQRSPGRVVGGAVVESDGGVARPPGTAPHDHLPCRPDGAGAVAAAQRGGRQLPPPLGPGRARPRVGRRPDDRTAALGTPFPDPPAPPAPPARRAAARRGGAPVAGRPRFRRRPRRTRSRSRRWPGRSGWVRRRAGVLAASCLPPERHPAAVSEQDRTKAPPPPPGRAGEGGLSGIPTVTVRKPLRPRGRGLEVGAQGGVRGRGRRQSWSSRIARRSGGAGAPDRRRSCGWGSWEPV